MPAFPNKAQNYLQFLTIKALSQRHKYFRNAVPALIYAAFCRICTFCRTLLLRHFAAGTFLAQKSCRGFRPLSHHRTCHLWHTAVSNQRLRSRLNEMYPSARNHALSILIFAGCEHAILHHRHPIATIPLHSFRLHPILSKKRRMPLGCLHCLRRKHRNLRRALFPLLLDAFVVHHSRLEQSADIAEHSLVFDAACQSRHQDGSLPPRSCSSGLGFRIIAAPCGLSPQCAYRVGRTQKTPVPQHQGLQTNRKEIVGQIL